MVVVSSPFFGPSCACFTGFAFLVTGTASFLRILTGPGTTLGSFEARRVGLALKISLD
jgi:hypothetical protein